MRSAILIGCAMIASAINQDHVAEKFIAVGFLIILFFIWDCYEGAVKK